MTVDLSKLNFWSGANYMKRIADPTPYTDVTLAAFGSQTITVDHNLGNIPEYDVQAELEGTGVDAPIWTGTIPYVGMNQGAATPSHVNFNTWISTTALTIALNNPTGSSITVRVYHIIYKDYA